jgi:hypothetical protein
MAVRPVAFDSNGITVSHDEAGHGGLVRSPLMAGWEDRV